MPPRTFLDVLFWILFSLDGWCWSLYFIVIGMCYLDFTNKCLEDGQGAILPFFVFHQPVITILATYAVQWQTNLLVKLRFPVTGSFLVTLGIYEFLVRRLASLSQDFGVKAPPHPKTLDSLMSTILVALRPPVFVSLCEIY